MPAQRPHRGQKGTPPMRKLRLFLTTILLLMIAAPAFATGTLWLSLDGNGDLVLWGDTDTGSADTYDVWIALGAGSGVELTDDYTAETGAGFEDIQVGFETIAGREYLHIKGESSDGAESGSFALGTITLDGSGCRDVIFYNPGGNESDFFLNESALNADCNTGSTCIE